MIHLVNSWLLLLLPLPWLIRRYLVPAKIKQNAGLKVPFYASLTQSINADNKGAHSKRLILAYLAWFFLILAAAGPEWLGKMVELPRSGRDILMAIDISGSMQIPDMELHGQNTNRLAIVKQVAQQFIKDRAGDRLGLILFGTRAYLQAPLTFDLTTVRHMLLDSTVGLAGTQTAIGDAIGMAIKHFKKLPSDNKVLILLTDGVNNEGMINPVEAATIAAKYGIRIYTVGLGSNQIMVPSLLGPQVITGEYELDETTLKEIARLTRGIYFRAKDPNELSQVYAQLNKMEPRVGDKESFRSKTQLYYWPLGIALGLVMLMVISTALPLNRFFAFNRSS